LEVDQETPLAEVWPFSVKEVLASEPPAETLGSGVFRRIEWKSYL
jgi:hypothetical protein